MGEACGMHSEIKKYVYTKGRIPQEDLDVDGRLILKRVLQSISM
jgi:spore coat protein CotF